MQVGGISTNGYLALAAGNPIVKLRQSDADIRTQALRSAQAAGGDAVVISNIKYAVGPDGQLYATGGTVSTSKRTLGPEQFQQPGNAGASNDNGYLRALKKPTFGDILPPQLSLSSADFASLFESQSDSGDALSRAKLQIYDTGVRSHERQHFFAAGGLADGVPEYEYVEGPDGELYAVAGHVHVSSTPTSDPEKAARDAATLGLAATAPGDASVADLEAARGTAHQGSALYSKASQLGLERLFDLVA